MKKNISLAPKRSDFGNYGNTNKAFSFLKLFSLLFLLTKFFQPFISSVSSSSQQNHARECLNDVSSGLLLSLASGSPMPLTVPAFSCFPLVASDCTPPKNLKSTSDKLNPYYRILGSNVRKYVYQNMFKLLEHKERLKSLTETIKYVHPHFFIVSVGIDIFENSLHKQQPSLVEILDDSFRRFSKELKKEVREIVHSEILDQGNRDVHNLVMNFQDGAVEFTTLDSREKVNKLRALTQDLTNIINKIRTYKGIDILPFTDYFLFASTTLVGLAEDRLELFGLSELPMTKQYFTKILDTYARFIYEWEDFISLKSHHSGDRPFTVDEHIKCMSEFVDLSEKILLHKDEMVERMSHMTPELVKNELPYVVGFRTQQGRYISAPDNNIVNSRPDKMNIKETFGLIPLKDASYVIRTFKKTYLSHQNDGNLYSHELPRALVYNRKPPGKECGVLRCKIIHEPPYVIGLRPSTSIRHKESNYKIRVLENDGIALIDNYGKYVVSDEKGTVLQGPKNQCVEAAKFKLVTPKGARAYPLRGDITVINVDQGIKYLKTKSGSFVSASDHVSVVEKLNSWEKFQFAYLITGYYAIKAIHFNTYLSLEKNDHIVSRKSDYINYQSQFEVLLDDDGLRIKAMNGNFLRLSNNAQIVADTKEFKEAMVFEVGVVESLAKKDEL